MVSRYAYYYVFILSFIEKALRAFKFPKCLTLRFYKIKRRYVLKKLTKIHKKTLTKHINNQHHIMNERNCNIIWVCWLQGEENAPDLVKRCIENLRKYNSSKYEVIVIDSCNFLEYTSISDNIMNKYNRGIITHTHFSDILRFNLLMLHGGMWVDATYLTLKSLPEKIEKESFFTLASNTYDDKFIPMGRWSGNFIKFPKNDPIPLMIYTFFEEYWRDNLILIDYFLIDFYLELTYENIPLFKNRIDENIKFGDNCFLMNEILFNEFNDADNEIIINDTVKIYKLSYKVSRNKLNKDNTFYQKYINLI